MKAITFEEHLQKRYGKIGTSQRDEFEAKSKSFAYKQMIKENKRLVRKIAPHD